MGADRHGMGHVRSGIILVELPEGKTSKYTRKMVTITGKLTLNATDPENFLYVIRDAKVRGE